MTDRDHDHDHDADRAGHGDPDRVPHRDGDRDALGHADRDTTRDAPGRAARDESRPEAGTGQPGAPRDLADHVDAVWDAIVHGVPPRPDALAPELTAAARRLHRLDRSPSADPTFLARLREDLTMPTPLPLPRPPAAARPAAPPPTTPNGRAAVPPTTLPAPRRRPRRWWGAIERVVAAVLVLGLIGSYVALGGGSGGGVNETTGATVYLVGRSGIELTALDAQTLADVPRIPPLVLPVAPNWNSEVSTDTIGEWAISADGSSLVSIDHPGRVIPLREQGMTVVVRDGLSGPERSRFRPPMPILTRVDLSHDGGRLLATHAEIDPLRGVPVAVEPRRWTAFDTTNGRALGTITAGGGNADDGGGPFGEPEDAWLSPDGRHVVRLALVPTNDNIGPAPVRLVVYDAETGAEVTRPELPGVRAGTWTTERVVRGQAVLQGVVPGLAFSPDGRRLAVVHDGGMRVTLVNTERFTVERTIQIRESPNTSPPPAGVAATPILVQFDGPPEQSRTTWARFSADGRALFLGGGESVIDANARSTSRDSAMRRIDLQTGTTTALRQDDGWWDPPSVSPDGKNLYIIGRPDARSLVDFEGTDTVVQRLDAETLATLAKRRVPSPDWAFAGTLSIEVVPRVPNSRSH